MVKRLGQAGLFVASVEVTVTAPPQLSEMVPPWRMKLAESVAGVGTAGAH